MFFNKIHKVFDKNFYIDVSCERCQQKPAITFSADCCGDAITLCKKCWIKWFNEELLPSFDATLNDTDYYKYIEEPNEQYGKIYKLVLLKENK